VLKAVLSAMDPDTHQQLATLVGWWLSLPDAVRTLIFAMLQPLLQHAKSQCLRTVRNAGETKGSPGLT
jgi:hypothetical protein